MSSDWHKHKYIGKELWWAENHDNQWHRPFRGNISDARIYATALSEQDIAEMYKSIISVSKEGTMFGQDFTEKEKASINFGKNGKITASNFDVETSSPYEAKIKYLPDGTSWMRIHHLDVTKDKTYFTNASEVGKSVNKTNRYSRLNNIDNYKVGNNYEFMLTYPSMKTYTLGGYTPVDYIEFTGDQYIKTHINPIPQGDGVFTGHRWEIDAEFTPAPLIPKLTANTNEVRIWGTYKSD
jgi:hypothetical protein